MSNNQSPKEEKDKREKQDAAFAQQEKEQIIFKAKNSTPKQRLDTLEEMIRLFGSYKAQK